MTQILVVQLWMTLHWPKALYSGVLHDWAGGKAEGVSQGVSWLCGRSPLILLCLGVLSTQPLPPLNARLYLTWRQADSVRRSDYVHPQVYSGCWIESEQEKREKKRGGGGIWRSYWVNPPALHPEAQQSGEVGLMCRSQSRSKWKNDSNIGPTALSFIVQCLSL